MKKIIQSFILSMGLISSNVMAQSADIYVEYDTFLSERNETEQEFIMRIAPWVKDKTIETGWEICGVLAKNNEQMGVTFVSSQSFFACSLRKNIIPENMIATDISIHSHPGPNAKIYDHNTYNDYNYSKITGHSNIINSSRETQKHIKERMAKINRKAGFSQQDFRNGPGYLILEEDVLHQEGLKTTKRIGKIR